jgi:hypothetical protein
MARKQGPDATDRPFDPRELLALEDRVEAERAYLEMLADLALEGGEPCRA